MNGLTTAPPRPWGPAKVAPTTLRTRPDARLPLPPARQGSAWDGAALQRLFDSTLHGEQVIVVSNRAPCTHERDALGVWVAQPASGLVTAMEPVMRACKGTWIAHGSGSADREFVDADDRCRVAVGAGAYVLRRLWLSADEQAGYCDGLANSGLWPLCHLVHVRPTFREADWQRYRAVNLRFAEAVVAEAKRADPIVLVQDYHLALVPALVRQRLPQATIVSFWHVPWAHPEQMDICPWLPALVQGLLGSDIVGLQTPQHRQNFVETAARCGVAARVRDAARPPGPGHAAQVKDYPISIAWPTPADLGALPSVADCRHEALRRWPLPPLGKLVVGVDRLDYTKGIVERLLAIEHLLQTRPEWLGRLRFVQVAAPTRGKLKDYAALRVQVHAEVQRINARFACGGAAPITLLTEHHDHAAVMALYRAADLCLVTSLHDGMNLVAKEFVAARDDEQGVLILSRFAGAAQELDAALIVNPYDTAQVAQALHQGLTMPPEAQRRRMRSLRTTVEFGNVHRWAATLLLDAVALRQAKTPAALDVRAASA